MENIKQRITNPMTLIAIFATLSETSAAVSLPFLDDGDRDIYVWFLISFPFYLLFLFFATLNFNYRSLYAPSDFENGEHFITAMNQAERPGKSEPKSTHKKPSRNQSTIDRGSTPPPGYAQDPPGTDLQTGQEHYVRLPERVKDLYIVDIRGMSQKIEMGASLENIRQEQGKAAHAIVFITCTESQRLLKESTFKPAKNTRKHSGVSLYVAYNLNSNDVTVIDQTHPLTQGGQ
ncbi:hypothetical protein [Pseudomonas fluorescens]|uniref:Uncharacterized protein n=1 Tax=Pseudomonas fluorescens TaxID=294 RepID=A0A5E7BF83_PSEFL|nr:hypothetical protein [Pseudomonas fluorescens]VVN83793.1 hypothetical protein PS710_01321 [Pseudomonas fluorescens]